MSLTLVILAAGKGSRFGGDKPLAAVGPNGESLFEYSVYDALQAGFKRVVFVVSPKQNTTLFSERLAHYGSRLSVDFVIQESDAGIDPDWDVKNTREKPWGTGQAVLACRPFINTRFVVINADDYYGSSNFQLIGNWLMEPDRCPDEAVLPGYVLKNTLSNAGGVNRGICTVSADGELKSVREVINIAVNADRLSCDTEFESDDAVTPESLVSMNFWGFRPEFFAVLQSVFERFLKNTPDLNNDEFYIAAAVEYAIKSELLRVTVFPTSEQWHGITYARDFPAVQKFIADQTNAGLYPNLLSSCGLG